MTPGLSTTVITFQHNYIVLNRGWQKKSVERDFGFSSTHISSSSFSRTSALSLKHPERKSSHVPQLCYSWIERVVLSSDISERWRVLSSCGWTFTPTVLQELEKLPYFFQVCTCLCEFVFGIWWVMEKWLNHSDVFYQMHYANEWEIGAVLLHKVTSHVCIKEISFCNLMIWRNYMRFGLYGLFLLRKNIFFVFLLAI